MANVGDHVVERNGVAGEVIAKYTTPVPPENPNLTDPPLGYWESTNPTSAPQYYEDPNLALDGARNRGKDANTYIPAVEPSKSPAAPSWAQGRELASSGPHDGVPYDTYGVKKMDDDIPNRSLAEMGEILTEESFTGFQEQRNVTPTVDPITKTLVLATKLNHPGIP